VNSANRSDTCAFRVKREASSFFICCDWFNQGQKRLDSGGSGKQADLSNWQIKLDRALKLPKMRIFIGFFDGPYRCRMDQLLCGEVSPKRACSHLRRC
jgi:hypothetical protein